MSSLWFWMLNQLGDIYSWPVSDYTPLERDGFYNFIVLCQIFCFIIYSMSSPSPFDSYASL